LESKIKILKDQINQVQGRFKELCECKGKEGCDCDLNKNEDKYDMDSRVETLKEKLLEKVEAEKLAILDKIGKNSCNVN